MPWDSANINANDFLNDHDLRTLLAREVVAVIILTLTLYTAPRERRNYKAFIEASIGVLITTRKTYRKEPRAEGRQQVTCISARIIRRLRARKSLKNLCGIRLSQFTCGNQSCKTTHKDGQDKQRKPSLDSHKNRQEGCLPRDRVQHQSNQETRHISHSGKKQ